MAFRVPQRPRRPDPTRRRRPATLAFYRKHLDPILAAWRGVPLTAWTRVRLELYLAAHPTWAPRHVQMVLATVGRFARWAAGAGIVMPDPTAGLEAPDAPAVERRIPTAEEVVRVLDASRGRRVSLPVHLAACAGLSLGDIRALDWRDVDLARGWIVRRRQKTGVEVRVPIIGPLAEALRTARATAGPVCRGLPAADAHLHTMLRRVYRKAKVAPAGFHGLRHAWATTMVRAGVPLPVVSRLLAHSPHSSQVMRYSHPQEADLVAATAAVERALG